METGTNPVVIELTQAQELAKQLEVDLDSASPVELCRSLAQEILSSIERTILIAKSSGFENNQQPACPNSGVGGTDSPRSLNGSPHSENSNRTFKVQERRDTPKKRKTLPKWTSQVRLGSGPGVEGPMDDGYNWRKYGQKDILGAKYPRAYYRCTHRSSQGCLAMKQVQRSDENPSAFDVTYRGTHTCHRRSLPQMVTTSAFPDQELQQSQLNPLDLNHQYQNEHLLLSFQTSLKVKTEGLDTKAQEPTSSSFSFPSTPVDRVKRENHIFSSSSTLDNCFLGSFSPAFISPTTSESNYFSVSPCRGGPNLQASESDFTEILSAATSTTNSPILDMDFMLDPVEFDPDFPFDTSSFFS